MVKCRVRADSLFHKGKKYAIDVLAEYDRVPMIGEHITLTSELSVCALKVKSVTQLWNATELGYSAEVFVEL